MANAFKQIQLGSDRYIAYGFDSTPLNPLTVGVQGSGLMSSLSDLQDWRDAYNSWCNQISGKELVRQLYNKIPNGGTYNLKDSSATTVATVSFTTTNGLKLYYCTYEWNRMGRYNFQSSTSGYPAYLGTYTAGVKFRVISSGDASNIDTSSLVTLTRGNTSVSKNIIGVTLGVDDVAWFDTSSSAHWIELPGSLSAIGASNIMGKESHLILFGEDTRNSGKKLALLEYDGNYTQSPYYNPFTITGEIDISDVTNVEPEPQPEVEYMNEINDRFSPRIRSNTTGAYIIDPDDMANFTHELVTTNPSEIITNAIFDTSGEYILGFRWYYGLKDAIDNIASTSTHPVNIGGGHLGGTETYNAKYCTTEFVEWHTSEMNVTPYFDNYLDLMCSYELYLPYYGFLSIDPNDIVGGTIQVYYNINIITGFANINVVCKTSRTNNLKVKSYSVSTQIGLDIPFGKDILKTMLTSWAQTCSKAFATGASIGSVGAFQEYSQMLDHNNDMINSLKEDGGDAKMDDIQNKLMGKSDYIKSNIKATAKYGATKIPNALEAHPVTPVARSNSSSNENGSLDELFPYLLITRPMIAYPQPDGTYEEYVGMPSYASATLSAVHGFTQIAAVKPETLTNAPKYLNEIISLLQAGVYL